jgi:hypothetical protein
VRIGELLIMADRLCETDVLMCVETSLQSRLLIGQLFLQSGWVNQDCLETALQLQSRVGANALELVEAAEFLRCKRFEPN